MKINIIGQRNILGGGIHFRNFCDELKKVSFIGSSVHEWDLTNKSQLSSFYHHVDTSDINIFFFGFTTIVRPPPGFNIVWAIFETDTLSENYVNVLNLANLIWVPSHWGLDILIRHGLDLNKIIVIPEGVNADLYHPYMRQRESLKKSDNNFRFLMVGKYEERKGYGQLIAGFNQATEKIHDIELLIKPDYFLKEEEKKHALSELIKRNNSKNIKTIQGKLTDHEIVALYASADAFIFPTRAEGWGLPLIEAIASGLPVIATDYSGQSEYLSKIQGLFFPLKYSLVPIRDNEYKQYWQSRNNSWGNWAQVDVDSLATGIEEIRKNYPTWQKKSLLASEIIRKEFSWSRSVNLALTTLASFKKFPTLSIKIVD